MKNQVIAFLTNLPEKLSAQFNGALELYRSSNEHNPNVVRHLNASGYSPDNLATLLYELKKLHQVKASDLIGKPVTRAI